MTRFRHGFAYFEIALGALLILASPYYWYRSASCPERHPDCGSWEMLLAWSALTLGLSILATGLLTRISWLFGAVGLSVVAYAAVLAMHVE